MEKDNLVDVPPWEKPLFILPELSEYVRHQDKNHTLPRLLVDDESVPESVPLLLQSHPGLAIVPLSSTFAEAGFMLLEQVDYIDLGIGMEKDAVRIRLRPAETVSPTGDPNYDIAPGRSYELESDDGSFMMMVSADLVESAPVTLTSLKSDDGRDYNPLAMGYCTRCQFIVHKDDSLSPVAAPHLAIGISPFPAVTLVSRDSPDRLLFRYTARFWSAPAPVDGVPLELSSHPGLAVVPIGRRYGAYGLFDMTELGVGPTKDALRLGSLDSVIHHQFHLYQDVAGSRMRLMPLNVQVERGASVRLMGYNTTNTYYWAAYLLSTRLQSSRSSTWTINEDGSVSFLKAHHLVLGCEHIRGG